MSDRPPSVRPSLAGRPAPVGRPSRQKSSVTNRTRLVAEGDDRGPWARRVRDLIALHEDDVGDPDTLSEAQRSLVRRCAVLEVELERLEGQMSTGEDVSIDEYGRAVNTLGRQLDRLGIKRGPRTKTINPLTEHFARPPD